MTFKFCERGEISPNLVTLPTYNLGSSIEKALDEVEVSFQWLSSK